MFNCFFNSSNSSFKPRINFSVGSSLTTALFWICFARSAYCSVPNVSLKFTSAGLMAAIMIVLLFPPNDCFNKCVLQWCWVWTMWWVFGGEESNETSWCVRDNTASTTTGSKAPYTTGRRCMHQNVQFRSTVGHHHFSLFLFLFPRCPSFALFGQGIDHIAQGT